MYIHTIAATRYVYASVHMPIASSRYMYAYMIRTEEWHLDYIRAQYSLDPCIDMREAYFDSGICYVHTIRHVNTLLHDRPYISLRN